MIRRLCVLTLILSLTGAAATAGPKEFVKGAFYLTPQVGINQWTIPFGIAGEFALTPNIGLGGTAMVWLWSSEFVKESVITLSAEALYHFTKLNAQKFDLFAGAGLGYSIYSYDLKGGFGMGETAGSGLYLHGILGGRYWFSAKMAVSLRLVGSLIGHWAGFGGQLGLTFRVN